VIFVDTNVLMYAVGRPHPLRAEAREFFAHSVETTDIHTCTSAEVLQELLHAYLPVQRSRTLDAALDLARQALDQVFAVEPEDVFLARALSTSLPGLSARDLLHLGCCQRRGIARIKTFDRALAATAVRIGARPG